VAASAGAGTDDGASSRGSFRSWSDRLPATGKQSRSCSAQVTYVCNQQRLSAAPQEVAVPDAGQASDAAAQMHAYPITAAQADAATGLAVVQQADGACCTAAAAAAAAAAATTACARAAAF
jgi:hypothetical protein